MKRIITLAISIFLLIVSTAHAELHNRGNGLIYDDDLNITWLQDANYAETSGYEDRYYATTGPGRMEWSDAMQWAGNLVYSGYDDWRLPSGLAADGPDPCYGYDCTTGELGHLYYVTLGNVADTSYPYEDMQNTGPFINIMPESYWTSWVPPVTTPMTAISFETKTGNYDISAKFIPLYSWAVRDGDVAPPVVPEPISSTLFLIGSGVMGFRRFRKA